MNVHIHQYLMYYKADNKSKDDFELMYNTYVSYCSTPDTFILVLFIWLTFQADLRIFGLNDLEAPTTICRVLTDLPSIGTERNPAWVGLELLSTTLVCLPPWPVNQPQPIHSSAILQLSALVTVGNILNGELPHLHVHIYMYSDLSQAFTRNVKNCATQNYMYMF